MKFLVQILELYLIYFVLSECQGDLHKRGNERNRLSLVHLIRSRRFDFTMFGCTDCQPVMECHTDSYCRYKKGDKYSCQFRCCSFRCVIASSGGHRASNIFQHDESRDETGAESDNQQQNQDFMTYKQDNDGKVNETVITTPTVPFFNFDITFQSTTVLQNGNKDNDKDEDG